MRNMIVLGTPYTGPIWHLVSLTSFKTALEHGHGHGHGHSHGTWRSPSAMYCSETHYRYSIVWLDFGPKRGERLVLAPISASSLYLLWAQAQRLHQVSLASIEAWGRALISSRVSVGPSW
jgi:hypothetical protein